MVRIRLGGEPGGKNEAQGDQNERTGQDPFPNDPSASPEWFRGRLEPGVGPAEANGGHLGGCRIPSDLGGTIWRTFGRSVERSSDPDGVGTLGLVHITDDESGVSRGLASRADPEDGCLQRILVPNWPMSRATSLQRPWAQSEMPQSVDADRSQLNGRSRNAGLIEVRERSIQLAQDPSSLDFTPRNEGGIVGGRRHRQRRSLEDDEMKSTVIPAGIDVHQVRRTSGGQGLGGLNECVPISARIDDNAYSPIEHAIDGTIDMAAWLWPTRRFEYVAL
jgi:hypothetical protein